MVAKLPHRILNGNIGASQDREYLVSHSVHSQVIICVPGNILKVFPKIRQKEVHS